jgi:hypothetical protein
MVQRRDLGPILTTNYLDALTEINGSCTSKPTLSFRVKQTGRGFKSIPAGSDRVHDNGSHVMTQRLDTAHAFHRSRC